VAAPFDIVLTTAAAAQNQTYTVTSTRSFDVVDLVASNVANAAAAIQVSNSTANALILETPTFAAAVNATVRAETYRSGSKTIATAEGVLIKFISAGNSDAKVSVQCIANATSSAITVASV
jgi:hypothetical protein